MPRRQRHLRIEVEDRSSAPIETVFAVVADALAWPDWTIVPRARLEREGQPAPDGVGAVRRFGVWPVVSREEVTAYEPPRRFAYRMLSGMPIDGYTASVDLEPDGTGTRISWRSSFDERIPGTGALVRWLLERMIRGFARGLARHAERMAGIAPS